MKIKKILAIGLSVLLVLGVLPVLLSAAAPAASERQLKFGSDGKFKIMHWIVLFMRTQLSRAISNYFTLLHQDTA